MHEVPAAEHLVEGLAGKVVAGKIVAGKVVAGKVVAGIKTYTDVEVITTPKRRNMKEQDPFWTNPLARNRKRIETRFSVLVRFLTLHVAQFKTFWALRAKVNIKIAAHNLIHSSLLNG